MLKKSNLNPEPVGADPTKYVDQTDWLPLQQGNVYNVMSPEFGATADNMVDDAVAVQAAITAAPLTFGGVPLSAEIYLPGFNTYQFRKPVKLNKTGITVRGDGQNVTRVFNAFGFGFLGPLFWGGSATNFAGWGASSLGSGRSLNFNNATVPQRIIYLHEISTLNLNLFSQIAVEGWLKVTSISADSVGHNVCASAGGLSTSSSRTNAFFWAVASSDGVTYTISTGIHTTSGNVTAVSGSLNVGTQYMVSINYDGANLWLYVNGVHQNHTAATGNLVQGWWETMTIGAQVGAADGEGPYGGVIVSSFTGSLDGFRISTAAQHTGTGSYTPPSVKFTYTPGGTTALLLNGDQGDDDTFVLGQGLPPTGLAIPDPMKAYLCCSEQSVFSTGSFVAITDLMLNNACGSPIQFAGLANSTFRNLDVITNGRYGIVSMTNNSFFNTYQNLTITAAGLSGVRHDGVCLETGQSGASVYSNITLYGAACMADMGSGIWEGLTFSPQTDTFLIARASGYSTPFIGYDVSGIVLDDEQTVRSDFIGGLLLTGGQTGLYTQKGGAWTVNGGGHPVVPAVLYDTPIRNVAFFGTAFDARSTGTLFARFASGGAPAQRISLVSCNQGTHSASPLTWNSNIDDLSFELSPPYFSSSPGSVVKGTASSAAKSWSLGDAGGFSAAGLWLGIASGSETASNFCLANSAGFLIVSSPNVNTPIRFWVNGADVAQMTPVGGNQILCDIFSTLTAVSGRLKGQVADGASAIGVVLDNSNGLANASAKTLSIQSGSVEKSFHDVNGIVGYPYTDNSGSPGNTTINKPSGRCAVAAAATAVTVTNSMVKATSVVQVNKETNDATLTSFRVVPASGSFTITGNAAATAAVTFSFVVFTN